MLLLQAQSGMDDNLKCMLKYLSPSDGMTSCTYLFAKEMLANINFSKPYGDVADSSSYVAN